MFCCLSKLRVSGPVLPVPAMLPCLATPRLIEEWHSPRVEDSAVYGTKWAHTTAGIPSPTDNPIIEGVRCASKRILGLMRSP